MLKTKQLNIKIMNNLIVNGNEVKVSQNGYITYIYNVQDTSVKSLIEGLNKETDDNLDDRIVIDEIIKNK